MSTTLHAFPVAARRSPARLALADAMRAMAALLQHLADRVTPDNRVAAVSATLPRLEFHGDAAAPEGALYVDGLLYGHLPGVRRL